MADSFGILKALAGVAVFWAFVSWLALGSVSAGFIFFANPVVITVAIIMILLLLLWGK